MKLLIFETKIMSSFLDVLVASLRKVAKFTELNASEIADIFSCVQTIQKQFEKHFDCSSTTIAIQDGPDAGQTVKVNFVFVSLIVE